MSKPSKSYSKQVATGDQFSRAFRFQREALASKPAWWRRDLLDELSERRCYKTDTYTGSYDSLVEAMKRRGLTIGRRAIIEAVRALVDLGLLVRDVAANAYSRRLRLILRTSVTQTRRGLLERLQALFRKPGDRSGDSKKPPAPQAARTPGDSTGCQPLHRSPSEPCNSRPAEQEPRNTGSGTSAAALAERAKLALLRQAFCT